MNNLKEIITDSLEYYDGNNEKYVKLFENIKYFNKQDAHGDMERPTFTFYDKNKTPIFKTNYEIIGLYNSKSKFWSWSWSIPVLRKNLIQIAKKILIYGIDLDPQYGIIKQELTNSRFEVLNEVQLDIHIALASYLSKQPLIFKNIIPATAPAETRPEYFDFYLSPPKDNDYEIAYCILLDYKQVDDILK
jgi:hypothetical protein